jgi:hypothetical protein
MAGRAREDCVLLSTAGPFTSAFFNPALAASITFRCSGHTLLEYAQVYWLGPLTGESIGGFPGPVLGPLGAVGSWVDRDGHTGHPWP